MQKGRMHSDFSAETCMPNELDITMLHLEENHLDDESI